jgi:NADH:ubiquinone oxidoreductase subunit 6 (subunit J)
MNDKTVQLILVLVGYIVVLFKIAFIGFDVFYKLSEKKGKKDKTIEWLHKWKLRTEFFYVVSMSLILIYIFYPWDDNKRFLTREIYKLIFLYGIVSIFTANWDEVFS